MYSLFILQLSGMESSCFLCTFTCLVSFNQVTCSYYLLLSSLILTLSVVPVFALSGLTLLLLLINTILCHMNFGKNLKFYRKYFWIIYTFLKLSNTNQSIRLNFFYFSIVMYKFRKETSLHNKNFIIFSNVSLQLSDEITLKILITYDYSSFP